jgi:phage terminase small subunit
MGKLKSRQERFCQRFVESANAAAAARAAGYSAAAARNAGYRLLRRPRIAARIAAIQAEIARDACRDVDVLLGKLETIYRRSVADHRFSTAARAVELQARISGLARHSYGDSGRVDWDQPGPRGEAGHRRDALPGNVTVHRSRPSPGNDN